MSKVTILPQSCKGVEQCGICEFVCPKGLYRRSGEMNRAGYVLPVLTDEEECNACEICMISCPDMAIVVQREDKERNSDDEDNHE
jgi:2-oxoglutarate ferredoxin oxidoreductase subunit delta